MNNTYTKLEKIFRWLLYGVFLCLIPLLLIAIFDWIAGYDFKLLRLKYVPDFLLMTFAIASNALSYATDKEKKVSNIIKNFCKLFSILSMFYCVVIYARIIDISKIKIDRQETLRTLAIILCVINIIEGIVLEAKSN